MNCKPPGVFLSPTGAAAMSTSDRAPKSPALAIGSETSGFSDQLDSISASLASAEEISTPASATREPLSEGQQTLAKAPAAAPLNKDILPFNPLPEKQPIPAVSVVASLNRLGISGIQPTDEAAVPPMSAENPSAQAPNTKDAAGSVSAKASAKSQVNPKSAQQQPGEANRGPLPTAVIAGQAPPLSVGSSLTLGQFCALPEQTSETGTPTGQQQASASGSLSEGPAGVPPGASGKIAQQTSDETRTLQGMGIPGSTASSGSVNELALAANMQPTPLADQASPDSSGRSLVENQAVRASAARGQNAKALTASAAPKTTVESPVNPKSTPGAEQPISLTLGQFDGLPEQTSARAMPAGQQQASTSGSQSAGTGGVPSDTPGKVGQDAPDETRTLQGMGTPGTAAPIGSANEFAFAARVQPAAEADQASPDASDRSLAEIPALAAAGIRKATVGVEKPDAAGPAEMSAAVGNVPVTNMTTAFQQPDSMTSSPKSELTNSATGQPAELPGSQPGQAPSSAAPLKDVSLSIEQAQGQRVDVRVVEQGGEVRVAVRAGDADVVQGLRQNLSELSNRLAENGFHAETWRPASSEASATASENKSSSGNTGGGDSQNQPGWSQQGRGGQNNQNQSNRPPWVQEFETSLTGGTAPTGSSDGIIS